MSAIRWISISTLAVASALVMTSCASSEHSPAEKYFLVATNIKVPYWQTAAAGLSRARAEMKVKAELVGPDKYDTQGERDDFRHAVAQKPDGILVSAADPNVMGPEIDAAMQQGIPVISLDSDAEASKRLFFIGTDNYKAGTTGGEQLGKLLNGKGNVEVFTIAGQPNLDQRLHGYRDALAAHSGIAITKVFDMKGIAESVFDETKEVFDSKAKIDAFVCLEAISCPEVADVVERQKMVGKVTIIAMDTDQRTLEGIQKGTIAATISQKPFTMAFYGLKLLDDIHHHKPSPLVADWTQDSFSRIPTFVDTGASLIDKSNVGTFLQQLHSSSNQ
jgi:ribose transport system substrate-binding protein